MYRSCVETLPLAMAASMENLMGLSGSSWTTLSPSAEGRVCLNDNRVARQGWGGGDAEDEQQRQDDENSRSGLVANFISARFREGDASLVSLLPARTAGCV
jgi:hypothetical protein